MKFTILYAARVDIAAGAASVERKKNFEAESEKKCVACVMSSRRSNPQWKRTLLPLGIAMGEDAFRHGDQTRYLRIPCNSVSFRSQQERQWSNNDATMEGSKIGRSRSEKYETTIP